MLIVNIITLILIKYYRIYITISLSNSMKSYIEKGNILIIKGKQKFEALKLNNIIVYRLKNYKNPELCRFPIMHRIVSISNGKVKTKGDNNIKEDEWVVSKEEIEGKLICRIRTNVKIQEVKKKTMLYNVLLYIGILLLEWVVYGFLIFILTNL